MIGLVAMLLSPLLAAGSPPAHGPTPSAASRPCRTGTAATALDFWIGEWDVYVGEALVGTNRVEPLLDGCAMVEHWRDCEGGEGKSLFAYDARRQSWSQVWVTGDTSVAGGIKQKRLVAYAAGTVTFQGDLVGPNGAAYFDRTILTRRPDGSVQQQIQVSTDGVNWRTTFDAIYRQRRP